MAHDPETGRFLPRGMTLRGGEVFVDDADGNPIGANREFILEAFRDYQGASAASRTLYDVWRFSITGVSPGRREREDEPSPGELEIVNQWLHDPTLTTDSSRMARLGQILNFAPIRGGGHVEPDDICTLGVYPIKPYTNRRTPDDFLFVPAHPALGGEVGADLDPKLERKCLWLVGEGVREAYGRESIRKVADLTEWRRVAPSLPAETGACAEEILQCSRALGVTPGPTPAGMAWRYLRSFLDRPLPPIPLDALAMAENCEGRYVILGPKVRGETSSFIYDLNQAYAYWLRDWPNLSRGHWMPVDRWKTHIAVYMHRTGIVSGQALLEGWDVEPYKTWRREITSGWAWEGDWNTSSPFREFVDACSSYSGPSIKLVKRFPALVVGKSRSAEWCDHILYARGAYYPTIWANVVGALQARMLHTLKRIRWIAAYIDAIHTEEALPTAWLGTAPGLWKLVDSGPTHYEGVGNWTSPNEERHQGRKLECPPTVN